MAHKVHPKAYRIRRIGDWDSRGFYKNTSREVEEDFRIRDFLNKKIGKLGIEKVEIERFPGKINVIINSAKPGLIIGRGGEGVERLKKELLVAMAKPYVSTLLEGFEAKRKADKKMKQGKAVETIEKEDKNAKKEIRMEIREVKEYWSSAPLVGQWVAQQIEKRMPFRKILKQGISKVAANKLVKGVRIEVSGRLNGSEIARREWLANGRMPRQTLRADIDYATCQAFCTYGVIGIKIWIYKGDKFE
jgi:small subunit ribosomal protein S3